MRKIPAHLELFRIVFCQLIYASFTESIRCIINPASSWGDRHTCPQKSCGHFCHFYLVYHYNWLGYGQIEFFLRRKMWSYLRPSCIRKLSAFQSLNWPKTLYFIIFQGSSECFYGVNIFCSSLCGCSKVDISLWPIYDSCFFFENIPSCDFCWSIIPTLLKISTRKHYLW